MSVESLVLRSDAGDSLGSFTVSSQLWCSLCSSPGLFHEVKLSPLREAQCNCAASSTVRTSAPCSAWSDIHHRWVLNKHTEVPFSKGPKKKKKKRHGRKWTIKRISVTKSALPGDKNLFSMYYSVLQ